MRYVAFMICAAFWSAVRLQGWARFLFDHGQQQPGSLQHAWAVYVGVARMHSHCIDLCGGGEWGSDFGFNGFDSAANCR